MRSRCVTVTYPPGASLPDLLRGCPRGLVFSAREQRLCGNRRSLTGWAGRLAAKLAVADLLRLPGVHDALADGRDADLSDIEIIPSRHGLCADPARCVRSHRPEVRIGGRLRTHLTEDSLFEVSISHSDGVALALATRYGSR